jgi:nucleotide-binding universal stress UspA family protein
MVAKYKLHSPVSLHRHIERILCPTNLSVESDQALRYAVALSQIYNAKLFLCYCRESPLNTSIKTSQGIFEESIGPYLNEIESTDFVWEGMVLEGEPATVIAKEAAARRVDLIVMSSRRRPYAAAILGSTAESLCRNAPCPVLVTHPSEQEWVSISTGRVDLKRILVAHDFSDYSELALSYGLSMAQQYDAELHLLHVLPTSLGTEWYPTTDSDFHKAKRRLQHAAPLDGGLWYGVKPIVLEGQPYREILSYATEHKMDLICMGAHGTGFCKWALFGSNADRVLRQAPCPVFIARPLKPDNISNISQEKVLPLPTQR